MRIKYACHQFIFGYSNGHSLLAGSRKLDQVEKSLLLSCSDLIPDSIKVADGYWSGIPLPTTSGYALMRTWAAPELPRPGCVWTHVILFDESQIDGLALFAPPLSWFKRPNSVGEYTAYESKTHLEFENNKAQHLNDYNVVLQLVKATYAAAATKYFLYSPVAEHMLFRLWMHQWGGLRRRFSFRTAGIANTRFKTEAEFSIRLVNDSEINISCEVSDAWEHVVAKDILSDARTGFGEFVETLGQLIAHERSTIRFLAQLYVRLQETGNDSSKWPSLLSQIQTAVPGKLGQKVKSIFLDSKAMSKFGLYPLTTDLVLNIAIDESEKDGEVTPWWADLSFADDSFQGLEEDEKNLLIQKFVKNEDRLPEEICALAIRYMGGGVLLIELDQLSISTISKIKSLVVDTSCLKNIDLSNSYVLNNLVHLVSAETPLLPKLMQYLLDSNDLKNIIILGAHVPEYVTDSILTFVKSHARDIKTLDLAIKTLKKLPKHIIFNELHKIGSESTQIYVVIVATRSDIDSGLRYSSAQWAELLSKISRGSLSIENWLVVQTYLLAIALREPEPGSELIFEECFVDVHDAWATGRLSIEARSLLRSVMSTQSVWTWDWCRTLTTNVVKAYESGKLDTSRLYLLKGGKVTSFALGISEIDI